LTEIWLEGDHYKWRLMRANGIAERFCTGNATRFEKFQAWAKTVPSTLRSPLYQWTHLELKRYFGIDDLLSEHTARAVWEKANALFSTAELSARGILKKFKVQVACTTDDPCDDLSPHGQVNSGETGFRIYPTFRPDNAVQIDLAKKFKAWVGRLEQSSNVHISSFPDFLKALTRRHDAFHVEGGRMSEHGLPSCYSRPCTDREAVAIFEKARSGKAASSDEQEQFAAFLMVFLARLDAERGWTKQLHVGALRSVNSRKTRELGPDTGFDCMGDWPQAQSFCAYLNLLEREKALPRMILYNVNPADNYVFASAAGSFQDGAIAGKFSTVAPGGFWIRKTELSSK
jgi:glucuronate isomerase